MIPYEEARAFVLDAVVALAPVASPLEAAWGCVAAEEIVAREQVPGFENSSMDGYALRAADTTLAPTRLRVVAATLAGDSAPVRIGAGEAARVMTGAPVPEGADCVCMVEETRLDPSGELVEIGRTIAAGENIRRPGEDVRVGDVLLRPGEELDAVRVGVVASQGLESVVVHPRPRVGVLSTGNELVSGGGPLRRGAIRDTNRPMVLALLHDSGCEPVDLGSVRDDYGATRDRLADGVARCDAVVSTGGISMGDVDHVKSAILELGDGRARWMQVAIRPGKPFAFGVAGDRGVPMFGLPGNPVSTRVSFELFVRPALRRLAGQRVLDRPVFRAVLDEPLGRGRDGKLHLVHVTARLDASGELRVGRGARHGSHLLNAIAGSNAIAMLADGDGLDAGDVVPIMILDSSRLVPPTS